MVYTKVVPGTEAGQWRHPEVFPNARLCHPPKERKRQF